MNLNTVTEVKRPTSSDETPKWREGSFGESWMHFIVAR
jgi:hypothetical protein